MTNIPRSRQVDLPRLPRFPGLRLSAWRTYVRTLQKAQPREWRALVTTCGVLGVNAIAIAAAMLLVTLAPGFPGWVVALIVVVLLVPLTYGVLLSASAAQTPAVSAGTQELVPPVAPALTSIGQQLARRYIEVQERERRDIARQLHDEAGEIIVSLLCSVQRLEDEACDPGAVRAATGEVAGALRALYNRLRDMSASLRPPSLDRLGLAATLQQLVETLGIQHELTTHFGAFGLEGRLSPEMEVALYRMVQEAAHNTIRHAHASRLDVLLQRRDGTLLLIIEDDGKGFDPDAAVDASHLGLVGMRERTQMLGGTLTIESRVGAGTTVVIAVPVAAPDAGGPAAGEPAAGGPDAGDWGAPEEDVCRWGRREDGVWEVQGVSEDFAG